MKLTGSRGQSKGPGKQTCLENDKCYREKLMRIEINYVAVFVMIRQAEISENKTLNKQILQFQEVQLGRDEQ